MKLSQSLAKPLASPLKLETISTSATAVSAAAPYIAAMTTPPDATRQGHIETLIDGLVADGVWAKLDWLSIFAAHDAQAARLNAVDPTQAFTVVDAPSFIVDSGYRGTSTTGCLNSNWDPATDGINFQQNSASLGAWSLTDSNVLSIAFGNLTVLLVPRASGAIQARINNSTLAVSNGTADSIGLHAADRYGSGTSEGKFKKNGAAVAGGSFATSQAPTTLDFYALALNNSGSPGNVDSVRRYAAQFWGGTLTDAEHTAIYDRLATYLTAVGAI